MMMNPLLVDYEDAALLLRPGGQASP